MTGRFDVSIVVPTYQGARYLRETLDSIAAQDLRGVEVLVVDDASTDDTVEIARSYTGTIDHLRVEVNERRLGAPANANRGMELARGRWIKPVFQDDLIDPGCVATMRAARQRGVPVVVAARRYRYEHGTPTWQRDACEHLLEQSLWSRFGGGHLPGSQVAAVAAEHAAHRRPQLNFVGEPVSILVDRRAARRAGGFDAGFVQLWDYELVVRLAARRGVVVVDEPLATFRVHAGSETARNLSGSTFDIDVADRLRLVTAYAVGSGYGPVRRAATERTPPTDLTAMASGMASAGRRLVDELPEADRAEAAAVLDELTNGLPAPPRPPAPGADEARNAEISLLMELSGDPLPEHLGTDPPTAAEAEPPPPGPDPGPDTGPDASKPAGASSKLTPARIAGALRTNQWWGHMLGPIMAFACLQLGWRSVPPGQGTVRVLGLVFSAIALVAYGYVVNDAADVEPDRRAGKPNAMAKLPPALRAAVIVGFAALGAVPWTLIRLEPPALVALAGIYAVPVLYSVHPLRLKERHLAGPLADASNAFVLPALFTIALFAPLGAPAGPAWVMVGGAVAWAFGFGLRAIVKHQVEDASHDRASGTRTLVVEVGERRANRFARDVLFPVELIGLALLVSTVLTWSWGTAAAGLALGAAFHGLRLAGVIDRRTATSSIAEGWWLVWYRWWPAVLLSLGLTAGDPWYGPLTLFIVFLFWPSLRRSRDEAAIHIRREAARRGARQPEVHP